MRFPSRRSAGRRRCGHCRRPINPGNVLAIIHDGICTEYCGGRSACRRVANETYGGLPRLSGASSGALGAALIAGDYVPWPWWGRLLPRGARDDLTYEMAWRMSANVEQRCKNPDPADEGQDEEEWAVRDALAEQAIARTGTPCCCLDPGADCPACMTGRHHECLENPERDTDEDGEW